MRAAISPNLFATDLADLLVERGLSFRDAHGTAAAAVRLAEREGKNLASLTTEERTAVHPALGELPPDIFDPAASLFRKKTAGSTHPDRVRAQVEKAKALLA